MTWFIVFGIMIFTITCAATVFGVNRKLIKDSKK